MAKKKKIDEQEQIKQFKTVFLGTEVDNPFNKASLAASYIGFDPRDCEWYTEENCPHSYDCVNCPYANAYVKYVLKIKKKPYRRSSIGT
ncbi:MAG: hypothetical protein ABIH39_06055 [Candidatus Margulisiibacteriota bacterium]